MTENEKSEKVVSLASKAQKNTWNSRMRSMKKLLGTLEPIEQQIIDLQAKKVPIFDSIQNLRNKMVHDCIHPQEYLTEKDGSVLCKFCNKKFNPCNG